MTGATPSQHDAAGVIKAAAEWGSHSVNELRRGGHATRDVMLARWAVISALRDRGACFAEIGRVLNMDHTSIINAERRVLEVQDLCTSRGLRLRQYLDFIEQACERRTGRPLVRDQLMLDGQLLTLRRTGKTLDNVQIWEVCRDANPSAGG